jgi:hypothetical protein
MAYILDLGAVLFPESIYFCRSYKNWEIITTIMDTRVTSVIEKCQRRLHERKYVSFTTFGQATMVADGVASKLSIAFLFNDTDVDFHFLKDVRLIPSSTEFSCCPKEVRSVSSHTTYRRLPSDQTSKNIITKERLLPSIFARTVSHKE